MMSSKLWLNRNRFILFSISLPIFLYVLLNLPIRQSLVFFIRGEQGDEKISVTINSNRRVLLNEYTVTKQVNKLSLTFLGFAKNIRLYVINKHDPYAPPRIVYITDGSVILRKKNIFNQVLSRVDILNVRSNYFNENGKKLFSISSLPMATVRSGISGWHGYYEMYPD